MCVWNGLLLQDMAAIPPVHPIKMFPRSASGIGRPWAPWEGVMALSSGIGESDLIYLGGVLMLSRC